MTPLVKFTLALLLPLTAFAAARGQDVKAPPKLSTDPKAAEMTEDVEVLRRLLNKAVGLDAIRLNAFSTFHPNAGVVNEVYMELATPPSGEGAPREATTPAYYSLSRRVRSGADAGLQFDGVYLKGHGIAYTVRLATLDQAAAGPHEKAAGMEVTCQNCHTAADATKFNLKAAAAVKPPTDWEKARDELRGGPAKVDPNTPRPNVAEMCVPGALSEAVTKLLAVNGRHLRHLTADESVSVVVTYDGLTGAAHDRVTGTMADPSLWNPKPSANGPATTFGLTADEAKQIVLGDLHLKQGKNEEAVKAYEAALARYGMPTVTITPLKGAKYADVQAAAQEVQKSVTTAYRSLAQAYIGVGNLDAAKRALELAQGLKVELSGAKTGAATPVPAKILLTVKKGHLDAAEKLSPAEFRKGVTVEMVGMTPMKK
ncbi:tetratricopeptide repeat protein [Limnoglobus roseus]|uniref:Cytochrome c domain-containing protein n=1 Tax=Limnoglobus roseus TaxID=2598579 RepID=A0A5C1AB12_9BACT|nr:tetratricopeptide repeat protein [Limnoglobus roseus]QEL15910.1 hypothetical protein PX52LOC_02846 [Limnoglobus roseus]